MGSHGIGIKRNDYHRRNRRRNISTHSTSSGINTESSFLRILNTPINVPAFEREKLIELALGHIAKREGATVEEILFRSKAENICVAYLRHCYSPYESLLGSRRWKGGNRDTYLLISKRVFDAIAESNSWLADECRHQYEERSGAAFSLRQHVRIVKGGGLTSLHVEELNEREEGRGLIEAEESEDDNNLSGALHSLASERFLFFPPFLKRDEIRKRRFDGSLQMNDRWWEWEEEQGRSSTSGRPQDWQGK